MAWTLCTSGSAVYKAGGNVNAISGSAVTMATWSDEAEGSIELETGKTYISSYASLPAGIKQAVGDVCSSKIAMKLISYDTTGYLSREADTLLNVNSDIIQKGIKDLADYSKIKLKSPI